MPPYYKSFNNYRGAWSNAAEIDPAVPLNVDIELAAVCNLSCPACFITSPEYTRNKHQAYMTIEMVERILSECAAVGVPAIKLNWRGESTLHPEFKTILDKVSAVSFHEVLINTNGNYTSPDITPALMKCTKVMYSLDSTIPGTYAVMRKGGDLPLAVANVKALLEAGHQNVLVRRVVTKLNQAEAFAGYCKILFGDKVKVSEHFCFDRGKDSLSVGKIDYSQRQYCCYPSQRVVVSVNGDMFPCCVDYKETMPLGNVRSITIMDAWRGRAVERLRKNLRVNTFQYGAQCFDCTSFMAYKAKEREYVQDRQIGAGVPAPSDN